MKILQFFDPQVIGTKLTASLNLEIWRKNTIKKTYGLAVKSGLVKGNKQKKSQKLRFAAFFGCFWGAYPNIMVTIQMGSVSAFQKGLTRFCSSNGLVSVADYILVTDTQTEHTYSCLHFLLSRTSFLNIRNKQMNKL